jgi:hypothetical protein
MAARLNIASSAVGGGSCSEFVERFNECCGVDFCGGGKTAQEITDSGCIGDVGAFNEDPDDDLVWDGPFDDPFVSPGPAQSQFCRDSKNNGYMNPRNYGPK